MGKEKSTISRKKLIHKVSKKVGISKKKARKAYDIIIASGSSHSKQKTKVVKIKKEVPVEVIKEVTVLKEINKADQLNDGAISKLKKRIEELEKENKKLKSKTKTSNKPQSKKSAKTKNTPKEEIEIEEGIEVFDLSDAPKPKPSESIKTVKPTKSKRPDNLTRIEGIGPAISRLLKADGITSFQILSQTEIQKLESILEAAGNRFRIHKPTTWPQQAALAADGKWDELKALQDKLKGGR